MLVYKVNGKKVKLPTQPSEVTLKTYCELELYLKGLPDWFKQAQFENLSELDTGNFYLYICKILSIFSGQPKELFEGVTMDELGKNSLILMYLNIPTLIMTYKPQERKEFKYRGQTYIVPHNVINKITGREEQPKLTMIEGTLLMQYNHIYSKSEAVEQLGTYHKILLIISVLCRKKGEVLPSDDKMIEGFTAGRKKLFENLPMNIALDVWFFLSSTYRDYSKATIQSMPLRISTGQQRQAEARNKRNTGNEQKITEVISDGGL